MGIDAKTVGLMRKFGAAGKGASLGYPHYVDRSVTPSQRRRSEGVFSDLGLAFPDVYDVGPLAGYTINTLDLNERLPDWLRGEYDYVVNPGTFDHVFNIGRALRNAWDMLKPGGLGFQHGRLRGTPSCFWGMTETAWKRWCAVNGELLHFEDDGRVYYAVTRRGKGDAVWPQENNVR